MRPLVLPLLLVPLLILSACGRTSPTEPQTVTALNGVWAGAIPQVHPPNEDWSRVVLSVTTTISGIAGTITPATGPAHTVVGERVPAGLRLQFPDLGRTSLCDMDLLITQATPTTIEGSASGRCPSTLSGATFQLTRVP